MLEITESDITVMNDENNTNINAEVKQDNNLTNPTVDQSSQSLGITTPCKLCLKPTSKKYRVFECVKCRSLVHFGCTRMPGYTIYLIKSTKRQYICECCVMAPKEFIELYDNKENQIERKDLEDIQSDIKKVADEVVKVDFAGVTKKLFDKIVEMKTMDEKFRKMEENLSDRFNELKENLVKIINEKEISESLNDKCGCNKEFLLTQINAKEN